MIADLELIDRPTLGTGQVKCYKLRLGSAPVAILATVDNAMLAICAQAPSPVLDTFIERHACNEPGERCAPLQYLLDVGYVYVYASNAGADWLAKEPGLLLNLRPLVASVLLSEPGAIDWGVGK